jgi:cytochrome P450
LLLACIARRFRLILHDEKSVSLFPSITLRPANGLKMTVRRRRSV